MTLVTSTIIDHKDSSDTGSVHAAFTNTLYFTSPNDRYVVGYNPTDASASVADLQTLTLVQNANIDTAYVGGPYRPACIDNDGSVWAPAADNSGDVLEMPLNDLTAPVKRFTMVAPSNPDETELYWFRIAESFVMPDSTIKLVFVLRADDAQVYDYHVWDKDTSTYTHGTVTWLPKCAFQDSNGDLWLCGVDLVTAAPITSAHFQRLTSISTTYPATQTFTGLPDLGAYSTGYNLTSIWGGFANGYFVGGWTVGGGNEEFAPLTPFLLRLNLDGSLAVTAVDMTGTADSGYSWALPNRYIKPGTSVLSLSLKASLSSILGSTLDPSSHERKFAFFSTADFSLVTTHDLATWGNAPNDITGPDDHSVALAHPVYSDHYLYTREAFLGQTNASGYFNPDDPDEQLQQVGELWLYYLGDAGAGDGTGDGTTDNDVTLRCWSFSLDGHDFYVLRLGASATLVYDLTTGSWSEWASPGRDNWRAHIGSNWLGMSADTFANSFGSDVVAGDDSSGVLWILDPTAGRDDRSTTGSDLFNRVVTGGVEVQGRNVIPCGAIELSLALGSPSQDGASVTLEMSDDFGHTWSDCGAQTILSGQYSATVEWRSLGTIKAPGRVFRITDNGASARISGAELR